MVTMNVNEARLPRREATGIALTKRFTGARGEPFTAADWLEPLLGRVEAVADGWEGAHIDGPLAALGRKAP
jgi:hypothetical protein